MILYLSSATAYPVYDDLYEKGMLDAGYQAQKFNHTLIKGFSNFEKVASVSALPYINVKAKPLEFTEDNVDYYVAPNSKGLIRKFTRIFSIKRLAKKIIKKEKPEFIVCDAILAPATLAAISLGKKYNIPTVAVITDVPEAFVNGGMGGLGKKIVSKYMKKYDYYVLLTKEMNVVVNPKNMPFVVVEGVCDDANVNKQTQFDKKTIIYTGSLWKKDAGLEYFIKGFINANIEDTELLFYGSGEMESEIEEISKTYPSIKHMGVKPNVEIIKAQKGATLLVNPRPSTEEFTKYSFPSKTMEYMASGTPVLTTKLKGIPEEYFDYLYTIKEEDEKGAETALKEFFALPEEERVAFGERAKKFVLENKNKTVQAKRILDFLREN